MIRKAIIVVLMLAALGTGVVWATSYFECPGVWGTSIGEDVGILVDDGAWEINFALFAEWNCTKEINVRHGRIWCFYTACLESGAIPQSLRFSRGFTNGRTHFHLLVSGNEIGVLFDLPLFPFILLFAAYPTIALIRGPLRRRRRRKRGLCLSCGYDLTGNKSGVCPECGKPIETKASG